MKRGIPPPTKEEKARIDRFREIGCICCAVAWGIRERYYEVHHITEAGRALGQLYTMPLCRGHHQGDWPEWRGVSRRELTPPVALSDGKKAFTREYGSERELWETLQTRLDLPITWPETKTLPRRLVG